MMVGTLLSNQVILKGKGIEPIHALFDKDNRWMVTDLGST